MTGYYCGICIKFAPWVDRAENNLTLRSPPATKQTKKLGCLNAPSTLIQCPRPNQLLSAKHPPDTIPIHVLQSNILRLHEFRYSGGKYSMEPATKGSLDTVCGLVLQIVFISELLHKAPQVWNRCVLPPTCLCPWSFLVPPFYPLCSRLPLGNMGWGRNVSVCAWNLKDLVDGGIVLCINCLRDARSDW